MTKEYDVELHQIRKCFGSTVVVDDFNLQVERGECVTFLGPSGCGKTTTLNMLAGFLEPNGGTLTIKGKPMNGVPSNKRDLGMVFQTYSLFPHMTVAENVAYGLKLRKIPKSEIAARVNKVLELVKLPHLADRYPKQLSGGQRQRIAIARALVTEPSVLLLDEPLSNLDAKLREELREEMKRLQQELKVTTIFVTHDQEEAMYMSDRIVVLDHGRVEQIGTPEEIYQRPASPFVHEFVGKSNRFQVKLAATDEHLWHFATKEGILLQADRHSRQELTGDAAVAYVRPEHIVIQEVVGDAPPPSMNTVFGIVRLVSFLGSIVEVIVECHGQLITVRNGIAPHLHLVENKFVQLSWDSQHVSAFPAKEA
ncbi:ABC transporter ATP-binding protein [Paenibacillus glucanolyticus]|uniref:ABC transporter ATP-binding protein n=1 Tax=Paenibacillus glucanolyticus TaxID=59843 RepID=UPI0030C8EAF5